MRLVGFGVFCVWINIDRFCQWYGVYLFVVAVGCVMARRLVVPRSTNAAVLAVVRDLPPPPVLVALHTLLLCRFSSTGCFSMTWLWIPMLFWYCRSNVDTVRYTYASRWKELVAWPHPQTTQDEPTHHRCSDTWITWVQWWYLLTCTRHPMLRWPSWYEERHVEFSNGKVKHVLSIKSLPLCRSVVFSEGNK